MSVEDFLDSIEKRALLPPETVAALRNFVEKSIKIVTPEAMAKSLVERGRLTEFQAKQLLAEQKPAASVNDELELAPDDEPPKRSAAVKPTASPKSAPPKSEPVAKPAAAAKPASSTAATQPKPASSAAVSRPSPAPAAPTAAPTKPSTAPPAKPRRAAAETKPAAAAKPVATAAPAAPDLGISLAGAGPLDDMFGEAVLDDGSLGAEGSPLMPVVSRRRRSTVPKWVWISSAAGTVAIIAIIVLIVVLTRSNGDREWTAAEKDYTDGSYQEAIYKLEPFIERFPKHPKASLARVYLGMARFRLFVAAKGDWEQPLTVAREVLPPMVEEPEFPKARDTLAKLLPEMAAGLAKQAKDGSKGQLDQRRRQAHAAEQGLALADDWRFVPDSLKPWALLQSTADDVARLSRSVARDTELEQALPAIRSAAGADKVADALARRDQLFESYPELRQSAAAETLSQELARAELKAIKIDSQPRKAATRQGGYPEPRATPVISTVLLAGISETDKRPGPTVALFTSGTVYFLNSVGGTPTGRQFVGFDSVSPVHIEDKSGTDFILFDAVHRDLLRVSGDNALRWRQPLEDAIDSPPLVAGNRVFVATRSGRLLMIDTRVGSPGTELEFAL